MTYCLKHSILLAFTLCLGLPAGARDCPIVPQGLIGERWRALDGTEGPLGCPVGPESRIEGQKDLPGETTSISPALAEHAGRLFLAWKGSGNDSINLLVSNNGGVSFDSKTTFTAQTDGAPALASDGNSLYLAWRGSDNDNLNVARVVLFANTNGVMGIEGLGETVTLPETSDADPAIAFHDGRLFLAWRGSGNEDLNIAASSDGGRSFPAKATLRESSDTSPALASTDRGLFLAWKGSNNDAINVARVALFANTAGGFGIEGVAEKATLLEETDAPPALGFHEGRLFLAWKGSGNKSLNLAVAAPGSLTFDKTILQDQSENAPALATAAGRLWTGWRGVDNERLNVASALLVANTAGAMSVERLEGRPALKQRFEFGEIAWSPMQGPRMLVAAYRQDEHLIVNWGSTRPFEYEKFIVRWTRDGQSAQADVEDFIEPDAGFFRLTDPAPGRYSIIVEGCTVSLGGSSCGERWTVPVEVEYQPPVYPACAGAPPAGMPAGDHWRRLGAERGALGCPVTMARPEEMPPVIRQGFAGGEILTMPMLGPAFSLAAFRDGDSLVAEWGAPADPQTTVILAVERDGEAVPADLPPGTAAGRWALPNAPPGTYRLTLQGCGDNGMGLCAGNGALSGVATVVVPPAPVPVTCPIVPEGVIGARWTALGAATGELGCATGPETAIGSSQAFGQAFDRGGILRDPSRGAGMTLAATQTHNAILLRWGSTAPDSFDTFHVRMLYNGVQVADLKVETDDPVADGELLVKPERSHEESPGMFTGYGTGRYEFTVEGCEDGDCGGGNRTAPVALDFVTTAAGGYLGDLGVPTRAEQAVEHRATRTLRVAEAQFNAAADPIKRDTWGEGEPNQALGSFQVVADREAKGWPRAEIRRPAAAVPVLTEINNALRVQTVQSRSGTDFGSAPCKRTGDYDATMKGYLRLLYAYPSYLAPDVRHRLLFLLNKTGPYDEDEESWNCVSIDIPETENHLWMINSARYLTNQLWAKRSSDPRFDNIANGLADRLLVQLQGHLRRDFVEYNSRPYTRYTMVAILNLYDFAEDPRIRTAAQSVLDYVVAKGAVSTLDGRRNAPYRRRASHAQNDFFSPQADRLKKALMIYAGPTAVMDELRLRDQAEDFATSEMLIFGSSRYQPPNLLLDLMLDPAHRRFYQRFSHDTVEIYASEPDYLLVAGGTAAGYAYEASPTFGTVTAGAIIGGVIGGIPGVILGGAGSGILGEVLTGESSPLTEKDDRGYVQPTYLMPTGQFTTMEQMIRFEGRASELSRNSSACVAPGFACGARPLVPALYTARPGCSIPRGDWTFIDFASDTCRDPEHRQFGFFAAVNGAGRDFGMLEVVPKGRLDGMTLDQFADAVIARNPDQSFTRQGEHVYNMTDGRTMRFIMGDGAIILGTGDAGDDALIGDAERLAAGTILQSDPGQSAMTIRNPTTGDTLRLDLVDAKNPVRVLTEGDPLRRLLGHGFDFSVQDAEIRDWIVNPFTPYPAFAAAIERQFPDGGLRRPVYIDVVAWNYEHEEGGQSPRSVEDVNRGTLEHAIISAHNTRYGEAVTRIEQILR